MIVLQNARLHDNFSILFLLSHLSFFFLSPLFSSLYVFFFLFVIVAPPQPTGAPLEENLEEHEHEYTHSFYPLDSRELTLNEQNFITQAQEGHLEACQQLLALHNVDVDVQDQWGSTALMHSINKKHVNLVLWLLSKKADINKQDYVSQTNTKREERRERKEKKKQR